MSGIVICSKCGERIFECKAVGRDFSGARVTPEDFVPLGDFSAPKEGESMDCPKCGKLFAYPIGRGQLVLKLEGGLWWPHPPARAAS